MEYSAYLKKIKKDCNILTNANYIIEKLDNENNITPLKTEIDSIIKNEIIFASSELNKLDTKLKNFDFRSQLKNNTKIFKENLKIIIQSMGKFIS